MITKYIIFYYIYCVEFKPHFIIHLNYKCCPPPQKKSFTKGGGEYEELKRETQGKYEKKGTNLIRS